MSKQEEGDEYPEEFEDDFESESESAYSSASSKTPRESPHSTGKDSKPSSRASSPSKDQSQSKLSSSAQNRKSPAELSPKRSSEASSSAGSRSSSKVTSSQHPTETTATTNDNAAREEVYPSESVPEPHQDPVPESAESSTRKAPPRGAAGKKAPAGKLGASQKRKAGASTKGGSVKQRHAPVRVQPSKVPANQEQLNRMLEQNAQLKDDIYSQHVFMFNSSKSNNATQKQSTMGGTAAGGTVRKDESKKDVAARSVQEALLQERMAQMLRAEQKDLRLKKKELEETIQKYRKASKYRHYVEKAKQDIADLTDENRDLQLEVRCNEKLLVMNASVMDSGDGSHRLNEELRAQNALTQRSLEHAIRDTSDAEKQRDATKERVDALREKLDARQDSNNSGENPYSKLQELREENNNKKMTVTRLKQMLQENQSYGGSQVGHASGAEHSYLEERIAHMKVELAKLKDKPFSSEAPSGKTANGGGAAAPPPSSGAAAWLNEDDVAAKPGPSTGGTSPPPASTNDNSDIFGTQPKKEANFLDSPFHPAAEKAETKGGAAAAAPPPAPAKKDEIPDWLGDGDDEGEENHDEEEEIGDDDDVEEEDDFAHELSVHDEDKGKDKGGDGGEQPDWLNF